MCGIFGAVSSSHIHKDLIQGLSKLEYRGYDSAGLTLISKSNKIKRLRCTGKVVALKKLLASNRVMGNCGIAHTRWACLLYTSPSPRDRQKSRMPSSA